MEYFYVLCVMFMNCAVLFQGVRTNELLMNFMSKVISNEKKIDDIELQLQELKTELNTITELLKQQEPGMGEIRKDIKDTIANTVTQMVKSQYVSLSKAMKREKASMLKTRSEMKQHMHVMNTAFNNSQRRYEERFTNQTVELQVEFNTQRERADDLMKNELNESDEHIHQQIQKFEDVFANKTETLDSAFHIQTDRVDNLIKTVLNESEQLHQTVESYTEETKNTTQSLEDGLKETLNNLKKELLEHLNDEASSLHARLTSQENAHTWLNSHLTSQMSSLQGDLRSYKSSADAIGSRVSSVEGRMTSHHVGFFARLTNKLPSIAKHTRIIFNDEKYDGWSDYDSSTGIFKAPISGMYLFMFTVQSYPSKHAHVCLHVSGVSKSCAIAQGDDDPNITGSNFYVTYLSAGTQVWVQTARIHTSYDIWPWRTSFSGVLIHI